MERQVADAVGKGATVETGGHRLTGDGMDGGFFYAPTILTGVDDTMDIFREETFGPIAPVTIFDDEDEVIAMANDTDYGLASYVYTQNLAARVPRRRGTALRHGRRQRHQPDVRGGAVRRGQAERVRAARAPTRASSSTSTPNWWA